MPTAGPAPWVAAAGVPACCSSLLRADACATATAAASGGGQPEAIAAVAAASGREPLSSGERVAEGDRVAVGPIHDGSEGTDCKLPASGGLRGAALLLAPSVTDSLLLLRRTVGGCSASRAAADRRWGVGGAAGGRRPAGWFIRNATTSAAVGRWAGSALTHAICTDMGRGGERTRLHG